MVSGEFKKFTSGSYSNRTHCRYDNFKFKSGSYFWHILCQQSENSLDCTSQAARVYHVNGWLSSNRAQLVKDKTPSLRGDDIWAYTAAWVNVMLMSRGAVSGDCCTHFLKCFYSLLQQPVLCPQPLQKKQTKQNKKFWITWNWTHILEPSGFFFTHFNLHTPLFPPALPFLLFWL